jgi:hypothetical protein
MLTDTIAQGAGWSHRVPIQELYADEVGWFAAFKDPIAGAALRLLHAAPFDDWLLESLARQVGASRTVLAERFNHPLDQPPMQYLAQWHLQLADMAGAALMGRALAAVAQVPCCGHMNGNECAVRLILIHLFRQNRSRCAMFRRSI